VTLGDPRYPTNFKKIDRLLLPNDATSFSIDLMLRKGSQVSFTFDSASTWNVGQNPENYKGAKLFFTKVKVTGPIYEQWPTVAERRILPKTAGDAGRLTDHLVTLLTHRSLPAADMAEFTQLARRRLDATGSKKAASRSLITAILSSPYFLYKHETPTLDDLSLANRLSYFLWNSAPDSELVELAKAGQLQSTEVLTEQVTRMLSDPKADRFCEDFTRQWLQTDKIDDVGPDERVNKKVTTLQIDALAGEAKAFFQEILANDLSMLNFIDSDFIMVNDLSARFYGFRGVTGRAYRRYELSEESERGGLIGQAGFLKLTSSTFETSPIQRGAWILKNVYGENIDPPADLKIEEPDVRGATTVKEVMAKHQNTDTCRRCHAKIDPLGFALEHYDPLGRWRDEYQHVEQLNISNDKETVQTTRMPIETESTMLDGRTLSSMSSLKEVLMEDKEAVLKGILSKLVSYSMGRETGIEDEPMMDQLYDEISEQDFSLRAAILAITAHEAFRRK
jgi:hypothetical protein